MWKNIEVIKIIVRVDSSSDNDNSATIRIIAMVKSQCSW